MVTEVAIVVTEVATVVTEVATVVTEVASVVTEVASVVVTSRAKKAVAEEAATVTVAMREMRTEAVLEEDILVLAPLPPSLLHLPEEEANLPTIIER